MLNHLDLLEVVDGFVELAWPFCMFFVQYFDNETHLVLTVGGLGSEARFQVKKSACFWRHGRYHE